MMNYRAGYLEWLASQDRIAGGEASKKYLESVGFRNNADDPRAVAAWNLLSQQIPGFKWEIRQGHLKSGKPHTFYIAAAQYPTVLNHNGELQYPSLADLVRHVRGENVLTFVSKAELQLMRKAAEAQIEVMEINCGRIEEIRIRSGVGPFKRLPNYITTYPDVVVQALGNLYAEYNQAFAPLVDANREWATDYQYSHADGPVNWMVQIDMAGLTPAFLAKVVGMAEPEVRNLLRGKIFEIENSLAMYQLLEKVHARDGDDSFFKLRFRRALAALKKRIGKPIALLAVTDQKYRAMKESEFGVMNGVPVSDAEVAELSGFDRFFGPEQFKDYLASNGGECGYLLYVRSSDPVAKLKDPGLEVEHPLLGDPEMRRLIKANAITFNVDDPLWQAGDHRRINDTKAYMAPMGMAFGITSAKDLQSDAFQQHLRLLGVDSAKALLRCKPGQGAYGCYGHLTGSVSDVAFLRELQRNLEMRGAYVVQPEMRMPRVVNGGKAYDYIDRNFLAIVDGRPMFLGGFRSLMPSDSIEAQKGRIHGNGDTVWCEIAQGQ